MLNLFTVLLYYSSQSSSSTSSAASPSPECRWVNSLSLLRSHVETAHEKSANEISEIKSKSPTPISTEPDIVYLQFTMFILLAGFYLTFSRSPSRSEPDQESRIYTKVQNEQQSGADSNNNSQNEEKEH